MTAEDFTKEKCLNTINKVKDANLRSILITAVIKEFDDPHIYKNIASCADRSKHIVYNLRDHFRIIIGSLIDWGAHPPIDSKIDDKNIYSWMGLYDAFIAGNIEVLSKLCWEEILNHLENKLQ